MARLVPHSAVDRSDAAAFCGRVARWDPAGPVHLVDDGERVILWAETPFEVLATRAVQGRLRPATVTVHASDLLAGLAVSTADEVDPGRNADSAWRSRLPPADGWVDVDDVPAGRIVELVRSGSDAAHAADRAAPGDQLQRQVRPDDLQAGLGRQAPQLVLALAAVREVAGGALRAGYRGDRGEVAVQVHHAGLHQRGAYQVGAGAATIPDRSAEMQEGPQPDGWGPCCV